MQQARLWRLTSALLSIMTSTVCVAQSSPFVRGASAQLENEGKSQGLLAAENLDRSQSRLNKVALPIWSNNADLCGANTAYKTWFSFATASTVKSSPIKDGLVAFYHLSERPSVISVASKGPADLAGIIQGDVLLSIDGHSVPQGKKGVTQAAELLKRHAQNASPVAVKIERNGGEMTIPIKPIRSCDYEVVYESSDEVTAFSDGKSIHMNAGMMHFTETDDELALVLSHELAHNTTGHLREQKINTNIGMVSDMLAAGAPQGGFCKLPASNYSHECECEADYVGLYYVARAGYDVKQGPNFWKRISAEQSNSLSDSYNSRHPSNTQRYAALEATVKEIEEKGNDLALLVPSEKSLKAKVAIATSGPR